MRAISLFSGSGGNCTLVDTGDKKLLIDAGGSAKAVCEALNGVGCHIDQIKDVFITHEHSDHTHALNVLLKKHPMMIHMTSRTAAAMRIEEGSPLSLCAVIYDGEFEVAFGDCTVRAFTVPHDSESCVGYRIDCGEQSVGVVTDIGYVTQRVYDCLCGCQDVMIEANHDKNMVKCGCYPEALKRRILSGGGHLSNDDCAEISGALARQGTKRIHLMHLSKENNTPQRALDTVRASTDPYGVRVTVSSPDAPTFLE